MMPQGYLSLTARELTEERGAVCLGHQLVQVIYSVGAILQGEENSTDPCVWYAVDVDGLTHYDTLGLLRDAGSDQWFRIGKTESLLMPLACMYQLYSGVFRAYRHDAQLPQGPYGSEGPLARDLQGALVEVVAFDTSAIEVFASDPALLKTLAENFRAEIKRVE
jgi:hypothetical protein